MRPPRTRRAALGLLVALAAACAACGDEARAPAAAEPDAAALLRAGDLPLAARFAVVDGELGAPLAGAPAAVADGRARWARLAALAPVELRRELSAFAVYASTDATEAFTRLDERGDGWIIGVAPAVSARRLDAVLLHELAHIATLGRGEVDLTADTAGCATFATRFGCARAGSCIARYVDAFWDPARGGADPEATTAERYRAARDAFLGPYAASLPEEDIVIIWIARVTGHPLDSDVLRAKAAFVGSCPTLAELERALPEDAR